MKSAAHHSQAAQAADKPSRKHLVTLSFVEQKAKGQSCDLRTEFRVSPSADLASWLSCWLRESPAWPEGPAMEGLQVTHFIAE